MTCDIVEYKPCATTSNLIAAFRSRVAHHLVDGPNLAGVLDAMLAPLVEVETSLCDMLESLHVDTAVGDQLTIVGLLFGVPRTICNSVRPIAQACGDPKVGLIDYTFTDDDEYRKFIKVRALVDVFDGTLAQYDSIVQLLFDDVPFGQALSATGARVASHGGGYVAIKVPRELSDEQNRKTELYKQALPFFGSNNVRVLYGDGVFSLNAGIEGTGGGVATVAVNPLTKVVLTPVRAHTLVNNGTLVYNHADFGTPLFHIIDFSVFTDAEWAALDPQQGLQLRSQTPNQGGVLKYNPEYIAGQRLHVPQGTGDGILIGDVIQARANGTPFMLVAKLGGIGSILRSFSPFLADANGVCLVETPANPTLIPKILQDSVNGAWAVRGDVTQDKGRWLIKQGTTSIDNTLQAMLALQPYEFVVIHFSQILTPFSKFGYFELTDPATGEVYQWNAINNYKNRTGFTVPDDNVDGNAVWLLTRQAEPDGQPGVLEYRIDDNRDTELWPVNGALCPLNYTDAVAPTATGGGLCLPFPKVL